VLVGEARAACCSCGEVDREPVFGCVAGELITCWSAERGPDRGGCALGEIGAHDRDGGRGQRRCPRLAHEYLERRTELLCRLFKPTTCC
jgi:hypothetical protein